MTPTIPAALLSIEDANMIRDLFDLAGAVTLTAIVIVLAYLLGA